MKIEHEPRWRWLITFLMIGTVGALLAGCFYVANRPPMASFTVTPMSGPTPLNAHFDASASTDVDGTIVTYAWNFGDTQSASGVLADHVFTVQSESKVFTVILTISDDDGVTDQATANVAVSSVP